MPSHPLARLGWRAELQTDLDALGDPSLVAARVTAVDRGSVVVDTGTAGWRAPLAGRLRASAMPATGDFVAVLPDGRCGPCCRAAASSLGGSRAGRAGPCRQRRPPACSPPRSTATSTRGAWRAFLAITARERSTPSCCSPVSLVDDPTVRRRDRGHPRHRGQRGRRSRHRRGAGTARAGPHRGAARQLGVGKSTLLNALCGRRAPVHGPDPRERRPGAPHHLPARARPAPGRALLVDTPGLRLVAPLEDTDEPCRCSTRRRSSESAGRVSGSSTAACTARCARSGAAGSGGIGGLVDLGERQRRH